MKHSIPILSLVALSVSLVACMAGGEDPTELDPGEIADIDSVSQEVAYNLDSGLGSPAVSSGTCGAYNEYTPSCASSDASDHSISATAASALKLWLRTDVGVTAPGGKVSGWTDQSGNGNNGFMTTASRQPSLIAGALNGKPVIRFYGAQSILLTSLLQPTTFTVFVVGKNSKTSESYSMILGPGGSSPNNQMRWENGSQALFVGLGNNMPIVTTTIGNTRVYHALSARYNGSTMSVYRDGNNVSNHSFTTSGPWVLAQIGAWFSSYYMVGDLAEILVYDNALAEGDRSLVNDYLKSKYALP